MLAKQGDNLFDQGRNFYLINYLILLGCTSIGRVIYNNKFNSEINPPYLLDTITLCANEEFHLGTLSALLMSSGELKKKYYTYDTSNNDVAPRSYDPSKYNYNPVMGKKPKWKMASQLIISAVTSKT